MFMGEYRHSLDDKNRLIMPAKFRDNLSGSFVITRGLDKCLFVYSKDEWANITDKLKTLPFTKKDARNFMRFFLSGATAVEFDKQGRCQIAQNMIEYADIKKDCVIVGVYDRIEIWSKENWDKFYSENEDNLSDIAEGLFDKEFEV